MKPFIYFVFLFAITLPRKTLGLETGGILAPPLGGTSAAAGEPQAQSSLSKSMPSSSSSIVLRGWMKWFTYMSQTEYDKRPRKFEMNQAYRDQFAKKANISFTENDRDQFGWYDIPDETSFFFLLTGKSIYAVTSRRNDIAKTVKSLELSWLEPTSGQMGSSLSGGITDLGNYKEGFCFRLKSKTGIFWVLCAEAMDAKQNWISEILRRTEFHQGDHDSDNATQIINTQSQEFSLPSDFPTGENAKPPLSEKGDSNAGNSLIAKNGSAVPGKWIVLQDWSQCTLACGGGKQYQQRVCLPPQNGGAPCQGKAVLERACNTQPCSNVIEHNNPVVETMPTVMKMQRISNRPQRYEACVVRGGDLDLMLPIPNALKNPRIPTRVILNNKTLTIFTTVSYDSVYKSFDLKYSAFNLPANEEDRSSCFVIVDERDSSKRATLCIMPLGLLPGQSVQQAIEKWVKDISFFKEKCQEKKGFNDLGASEDESIRRKKLEIELEEQDNNFRRIQERDEEERERSIEGKVEETAKIAIQAMQKEMKYEQLAIREEIEREKQEEKEFKRQLELEKEKEECLERELRKREKIKQLENQVHQAEEKVKEIQKQAVLQVESSRNKLLEKLSSMRKAADRKRAMAKKQIMEVRTIMASKLLNEAKMGNITNCNPRLAEDEIKKYCENAFDDSEKVLGCAASPMDFCYTCCENEFGRLHQDYRETCYSKCEEQEAERLKHPQKPSTEKGKNGSWVFVPEGNKVAGKSTEKMFYQ